MQKIIFILFLLLPITSSAFDGADSRPPRPPKYIESNYYDTIGVSNKKIVIRRDSLRKNFDSYFPKPDLVSYNDIDYISTNHLEQYIKKNYKDQKRASKRVWASGAGFPFYKPTTSFGIGGAAILSFMYDRRDTISFNSYIPISFLASVKGQFALTSGLYLFMKENKNKARARLDMSYGMANYFGSGSSIKAPSIDDKSTQYTQFLMIPTFEMLWRVADNFYLGTIISIQYEKLQDMAPDVFAALPLAVQQNSEVLNIGGGIVAEYSSIENPSFPYDGVVFNASLKANGELLSVKAPMPSIMVDYRQYQRLFSQRGVLAWQLKMETLLNNKTDLFVINPALDIRGVLERYHIASTVGNMSVEYRQFIGSMDVYKRGVWWSKIGFTVWGNLGMWGNDIFKQTDFVASYGGGFRYEIQPNKNFRFDIGTATGDKAKPMFYVGFLEYF